VKKNHYDTNIQHLAYQRNASIALSFILGVSLIIVSSLLIFKNERIVVVPYGFEKEVWTENGKVSSHYLEKQADIISQLLLNKTAISATRNKDFILTLTDPSFYGTLKRKLIQEEEIIKDQGVSFVFLPIETTPEAQSMKVSVVGDRVTYLGDKKVRTQREKYTFSFRFNGKALLLIGIEREEVSNV